MVFTADIGIWSPCLLWAGYTHMPRRRSRCFAVGATRGDADRPRIVKAGRRESWPDRKLAGVIWDERDLGRA